MDAETWMDAGKAVELGFADDILKRSEVPEDMEPPAVSMLYSRLLWSIPLWIRLQRNVKPNLRKPKTPNPRGRSVDSLYERLNLMKF